MFDFPGAMGGSRGVGGRCARRRRCLARPAAIGTGSVGTLTRFRRITFLRCLPRKCAQQAAEGTTAVPAYRQHLSWLFALAGTALPGHPRVPSTSTRVDFDSPEVVVKLNVAAVLRKSCAADRGTRETVALGAIPTPISGPRAGTG